MLVAGIPIPVSGSPLPGLAYNTLHYIFYSDPDLAGGAVTYQDSTSKSDALNSPNNFFVGSITTPAAGAPDTIGNNDGGAGAQNGRTNVFNFSLQAPSGSTSGNGNVTDPSHAVDGNFNTFAQLTATANGSGTQNDAQLILQSPPSIGRGYKSATLNVKCGITVNSVAGTPPASGFIALVSYTTQGNVFGNTIASVNVGSGTIPVQTFSFNLPINLNLSQVAIEVLIVLDSGQTSGSIEVDFYGAEIICIE